MGRRREVVPDHVGRQEISSLLPVRGPRQDPRGETRSIGEQVAFMIRQIKGGKTAISDLQSWFIVERIS